MLLAFSQCLPVACSAIFRENDHAFFEKDATTFYIQSMTTTMGYDRNDRYSQARKAIDALRTLKQELGEETLNEADTRHSFINSIIHDVMGWPKTLSVRTETTVGDSGIYDYRLDDSNTIGLMIIEAKKEGTYFDIDEKRKINADRLRTAGKNKDFLAAIEQAVNYARQLTIPYAMVCNGHQVAVVASVAQRGKPDEFGKAIIFKSLEDISEHLEEFLELFSFPELILPVPKLHNAITIRKTGIAAGAHVFKYSAKISTTVRL